MTTITTAPARNPTMVLRRIFGEDGDVAGRASSSVVTVLLVELLDTRVKRPEDIEDVMQIALLGVVPNLDKLK